MPILHSYYQDVYRCPIVRLDGYSAQHGLSTGILAYLDFGGATGSSKDGLAETMLAFATERGTLQPACLWWRPAPAASARRWPSAVPQRGTPAFWSYPATCPLPSASGCRTWVRISSPAAAAGAAHGARGRGHRQALRRILHPLFFQRRQPRVPPPRDGAADL